LEKDIERFGREYPELARHWGIAKLRPTALFDPGRSVHGRVPDGLSLPPDTTWQSLLECHVAGDWGVNGVFDEAALASLLASPEQLWLIDLALPSVKNLLSVAKQAGCIRSSYPHEGFTVEICSALVPHQPTQTLAKAIRN
jgi:hypothetical protein